MKNGKDEKLSELFSAYTSEEKSPDISATNKAKEYMNKTRVAEKATVTAVETAGGSSAGSDAGLNNRKKTLITVAVALFLIAFAIVCYYIAGRGSSNGTMNALTAKLQPVEIIEDHNAAWDGDYEYKDFLPFVVANDVETYREYKLAKAAEGHKKNDIAVYYVKVKISESDETAEIAGAEFEVYVEVSGVIWKNLDEYKNTKNSTKIENIDFYYGSENGNVYYFVHDDYGYNLKFINADDKTATLTYIAGKFTT